MYQLETFYQEYLNQVPKTDLPEILNKTFFFNATNAPQYIDSLTSKIIKITTRQLARPASYEDNIIFYVPKSAARALGIVILAVLFVNKNGTLIELTNTDSDVKRIYINSPRQHPYYQMAPHEMVYHASNLHTFSDELVHFSENDLQFLLTAPKAEFAIFEEKNELQINSSHIGLMILAERFLNLGLDSSITNYITIGGNDDCDIPTARDSCSGRIEVLAQPHLSGIN